MNAGEVSKLIKELLEHEITVDGRPLKEVERQALGKAAKELHKLSVRKAAHDATR